MRGEGREGDEGWEAGKRDGKMKEARREGRKSEGGREEK